MTVDGVVDIIICRKISGFVCRIILLKYVVTPYQFGVHIFYHPHAPADSSKNLCHFMEFREVATSGFDLQPQREIVQHF